MGWWKRLWIQPRPSIIIQTIEAQWPKGFVPLSKRDPERYADQIEKLRAAGINVPNKPADTWDPKWQMWVSHAISCEPECDGTDRFCKCSSIGPCWHHR